MEELDDHFNVQVGKLQIVRSWQIAYSAFLRCIVPILMLLDKRHGVLPENPALITQIPCLFPLLNKTVSRYSEQDCISVNDRKNILAHLSSIGSDNVG